MTLINGARTFWDIVGTILAVGVVLLMFAGLVLQLRDAPPRMGKWAQIVLDCLVILACMWAIWWLGRFW